MTDVPNASFALAVTCLVLVTLLSFPATWQCVSRFRKTKSKFHEFTDRYEDEDGVATKESQAAYSDLVQRLLIILGSTLGTIDALALAILTTTRPDFYLVVEQWLQFGTWILIAFQAATLYITPSSRDRYDLGIYGAGSCFLIAVAVAVENISLWQSNVTPLPRKVHLPLSLLQWFSAVILMFTNLLIPRRPKVYRNNTVVDGQNTVSVLGRFTFSWVSPVLDFAARNKGLNYDDLPEIDHSVRAQYLRNSFEGVGKKDKLWKAIFWSHKRAFIQQWTLQAICSLTGFLPQVALYFVLRLLEARDAGADVTLKAWLLVLALGAADTTATWVESWMFFVVFLKILVPVYEQLAAVVFGKSIRRKDVKGSTKKPEDEQVTNADTSATKSKDAKVKNTADDDDGDEDVQKTRQSTINLVGVDSKRIADFACFNYIFMGSALKLIFAIIFLAKLIGWIPLFAGLLGPLLITPINVVIARYYTSVQEDLMKYRDQKMAVVTEALQGIRQIKFSALERNWYEKILETRRKELKTQWNVFLCNTGLISIWIFGPVMLSAFSLMTYALIHKQLSASVAFTTISVFEAIEMTLAIIPEMVGELLDAMVSARRVQEYLDSPELENGPSVGPNVRFQDATIAWPSDDSEKDEDQFRLRQMNINFPKNELSVVSGKTGSGKSLLLAAIIGEADILGGVVQVPAAPRAAERYDSKATARDWCINSSIAYVAQIPWIENATIRDNILFGLPLDYDRYKKVLNACALEKDLEMLPDGEMTDIGANGINLSGGQKWRVSFARALYSRAGILVLDDVFSAVDANVGRHLYEQGLTGDLGKGRTRILVTHHVALCLPKTRYSVLLADGTVEEAGNTEELRRSGKLKSILALDAEEQGKEEEEAEKQEKSLIDDGSGLQKVLTSQSRRSRRKSTASEAETDITRRPSHATVEDASKTAPPKKFTEEENRATGAITLKVYLEYIRSTGGFSHWTLVILVYALCVVIYLARSYWITIWTRSYHTESVFKVSLLQQSRALIGHLRSRLDAVEIDADLAYYLSIYVGISLLAWVGGTIRYFTVFVGSIRASKTLFERLAFAVLRAPLRWLDTVPLGRILNRFTSDFNMLDSNMAFDLAFLLHNIMGLLSVVIAGLAVSPIMMIFAVLLLCVSAYFSWRYLAGAREVKRLESNAKSPVFEQFGSVLSGIGTIRAFDKADAYIELMHKKIDSHCRAFWHLWLLNRWMGWRLNMVGAVFTTLTAALIISIRRIDASLAGFALGFALSLAENVIWMLRQYANVELDMNATERIVEYSNIQTESLGGEDAPAAWPTQGELEINDLVVAYAPDLPPVLKGLTFSVSRNQRVGVVGRTGAGKSSLTLALFRFLEPRSGTVHIDGIDISKIRLYDLRSRLAIIPQDPVLFSGTVRSNLDAFDQHTDQELRDALARVHLINSEASATASGSATPRPPTPSTPTNTNTNINIFRSLHSKIAEGGLNLSQGQRQLLCLARAIVSRPKIMVLDEATSAVDMETDALIQRSIREEFQDSTLLVIAHRLSTIADFDRILVLGDGRVVEFGTPAELMAKKDGEFRGMVEESGERTELEGIIRGSAGGGEGST